MPAWQLVLGASAAAVYALASHWMMLHAADRPWAVAVILGPLLLAAVGVALRRRDAATIALALTGLCVLALVVARGGVDVNRLYVLQHAGIHAVLGWGFAASLRPGAVPTITALAARVHGALIPSMQTYTRRVTLVWAAYFFAMTALSLVLYTAFAWSVWSLFANIVTPLTAAALFLGEHALRYALHPEFERATMADAVRALRAPAPQ